MKGKTYTATNLQTDIYQKDIEGRHAYVIRQDGTAVTGTLYKVVNLVTKQGREKFALLNMTTGHIVHALMIFVVAD